MVWTVLPNGLNATERVVVLVHEAGRKADSIRAQVSGCIPVFKQNYVPG
jgi:hypothetical protein